MLQRGVSFYLFPTQGKNRLNSSPALTDGVFLRHFDKKVTRHQGDELLPKTQTFIERRSQKKRKKKPFSERVPKGNALTITQGANPVKYLFIYPYNLKFA